MALTEGHPWRAGALPGKTPEGSLDKSVFQGVVADHDQPSTRGQPANRRIQSLLETSQFVVDGDPQGLERPRRGMDPAVPGRRGSRLFHDLRQAPRGQNRLPFPFPHDPPGNPARIPFFPILPEDRLQIRLVQVCHQVGSAGFRAAIHPHIQGAVMADGEPSFRRVHVAAGDPQVQQDPVDLSNPRLVEETVQVSEVAANPDEAREPSQPPSGLLEGLGVLVDADQAPGASQGPQ